MNYERDEAMRQQDAAEAMIRMREPGMVSRRSTGPHPDLLADEIGHLTKERADLLAALEAVCAFSVSDAVSRSQKKHENGWKLGDVCLEWLEIKKIGRDAIKKATETPPSDGELP